MPALCIAHRGASAEAPENTLAAFERARALGADGIELDVQTSSDGAAIVFHDSLLRRLTGKAGRVSRRTRDELRPLRVGGQPIPLLEDALDLARGWMLVQIEIKKGAKLEPVLRAIHRTSSARNAILSSFDLLPLREALARAERIPRILIADTCAHSVRRARAVRARGVSLNHRKIGSSEEVHAIQASGLAVWCWTVNDRRAIRQLSKWGVDALVGDDPRKLREWAAEPVFRLTRGGEPSFDLPF